MKNKLIASIPFLRSYYENRLGDLVSPCEYDDRTYELFFLDYFLRGQHYNFLKYPFSQQAQGQTRIPLSDRRPCVRYNIAKIIVDGSTSLLFSESHYPTLHCEHDGNREVLKRITKKLQLNRLMLDLAFKGSVGSACVLLGVIGTEDSAQLFCKVMKSIFITPYFENDKSRVLNKVVERYKVTGRDLIGKGYKIKSDNLDDEFWYIREWTKQEEVCYIPLLCDSDKTNTLLQNIDWSADLKGKLKVDEGRIVKHGFGFVPIVWVRNLVGGNDVEGLCSFDQIIDNSIEIDYLLSQGGRGLKYSSEPLLAISSTGGVADDTFKDGNVLDLDADGNAKLLEINGGAIAAVIDYVKFLREISIEMLHGDKSDTNKLSVAQSGKAMELMHHSETLLADVLRISYGEGALIEIYEMILRILSMRKIIINDEDISAKTKEGEDLILVWGNWYPTTPEDLNKKSMAMATLKNSGLASTETLVSNNAADYDVEDVKLEISKINKDQEVLNDRARKQQQFKQSFGVNEGIKQGTGNNDNQ